jgi:hypothetical protein
MKRVIIKAPEGIELNTLTADQQAAIESVYTQFVLPMPGTKPFEEHIIIDAITADNFDPAVIQPLDLPFELMGLWQWDEINELVALYPLDEAFINFLPKGSELKLPHGFAGWPDPGR